MKRSRMTAAVCLALAAVCCPAALAGWHDFWNRCELDFHRMNCWPQPFQHAERQVTVQPLIAMTDAGWRLQNTLSDHFFDSETQSLTQAGKLKVRWIATQAPAHRRSVFILRGDTPQQTVQRVESVQRFLDQGSFAELRPEVLLTDAIPPASSGEYYDAVERQRKTALPPPVLPEMPSQMSGN